MTDEEIYYSSTSNMIELRLPEHPTSDFIQVKMVKDQVLRIYYPRRNKDNFLCPNCEEILKLSDCYPMTICGDCYQGLRADSCLLDKMAINK